MAVPRNRMSNARKNSKRAHHAKKPRSLTVCSTCSSPQLPHYACQVCRENERSAGRPTTQSAE